MSTCTIGCSGLLAENSAWLMVFALLLRLCGPPTSVTEAMTVIGDEKLAQHELRRLNKQLKKVLKSINKKKGKH